MKSGLVVLVGRSNVGKSTLLNTLVGTKIAATSFRAQMTRQVIHGVMNTPEGQAVFIDTPGIFQDKKNMLTRKLTAIAEGALKEVDLIVYVTDPTREIGAEERKALSLIRHASIPKILVINKIDLPPFERKFQDEYERLVEDFTEVYRLSALKAKDIVPLKEAVIRLLPEGEPLYGEEQLTNMTHPTWISEIIREKLFSVLDKEVPYAITVEVDTVEQKKDMLVIEARVLTNAERFQRMIIGAGGKKIKEIGTMARRELEQATGTKVFLDLTVETDPHWVERLS